MYCYILNATTTIDISRNLSFISQQFVQRINNSKDNMIVRISQTQIICRQTV